MFEDKREVHTIWNEKYRPDTLEGYIGNEHFKEKVAQWIETQDVPHLLLHGPAGTGKTTAAKIIIKNIDCDALSINASDENNVETVRTKIKGFCSVMGFKPLKVVFLDECLDENTLVWILREGKEITVPISLLNDKEDLVKSWNMKKNRIEWMPFELFNKGIQETFEVELDNNETIICTADHKWYVEIDGEKVIVKTSQLHLYSHILSPR